MSPIPVTFGDLCKLFQMRFLYSCAEFDKNSTESERHMVHLRQPNVPFVNISVVVYNSYMRGRVDGAVKAANRPDYKQPTRTPAM